MQQPTGSAAGAGSEIMLLDQPDTQAAHRGIAGDARSDNAAAYDQQMQRRFRPGMGRSCPAAFHALWSEARRTLRFIDATGAVWSRTHAETISVRAAFNCAPNSARPSTTIQSGA